MPSGSHGGGRGSHSSGGSRIGGSSFGGGRSRSGGSSFGGSRSRSGGGFRGGSHGGHHHRGGFRRARGPRFFYFGHRRYYISSGRGYAMSAIGIFLGIAIFVGIVGLILMLANTTTLNTIKEDYNYYQDMITFAENNPSRNRIRDAAVTDRIKSETCDKWYITYEIETDVGGSFPLKGESYSVYTLSEASDIMNNNGGIIKVAVNNDIVTPLTDSIPMDYKDMPLERDGQYTDAKAAKNAGQTMLIVCGIVIASLVFIEIFLAFAKRATAEHNNTTSSTSSTQQAPPTVYCNYCGARINPNDKKCSNCGASIK